MQPDSVVRQSVSSTSKDKILANEVDTSEEFSVPSEELVDYTGTATFFTYVLVFCVCVGGFLFGYDTGGKHKAAHSEI